MAVALEFGLAADAGNEVAGTRGESYRFAPPASGETITAFL